MNATGYIRLVLLIGAVVIAAQFGGGSTSSVDGRPKPDINIQGTLVDTANASYELEDITIAGRCSQIPVYSKPLTNDQNPENNIARLDLDSVDAIKVIERQVLMFNKREYIAIEVLFKGSKRTKNTYIIPRNYTIRAQESLGADSPALQREFSFSALDSLTITNARPQGCTRSLKVKPTEMLSLEQLISTSIKLIDQVEETTKQLPQQSNDLISDLKAHLIYLIKELRTSITQWTGVSSTVLNK